MIRQDGIPTMENLADVIPEKERLGQGPVAIVECFQCIPCNPCTTACPRKAIQMEPDINALPKVNFALCNGCGACLLRCPGLAIFIVDMSYSENTALVRIPFEFLPLPKRGQKAMALGRDGRELGMMPVIRVTKGTGSNLTSTVTLEVPKELAMEVRNIQVGGYQDE